MISSSKVTIKTLQTLKKEGQPIVALTAYDQPTAKILNEAEVDVILVGDSLGMVVLGYESTLPVTMDEMIHHLKAVRRGNKRALLVADMPYLSYETKKKDAVLHAGRFLKAGAEAVKLEGGVRMADTITALVRANIPVMAHIGMTPQSVHHFGGYRVQGRDRSQAKNILADARAVQRAGAFCVVLECVPAKLVARMTKMLSIPTIGIGAGAHCDGQILVFHDLVGYSDNVKPRFVKQYADVRSIILGAVRQFGREVRARRFPSSLQEYS